MGLIKTAMMTGGGIYAVKQLAKTADRRHDNNNYNHNSGQSSREAGYQNQNQQGYRGPGPGPQGQGQRGGWYQDQREYSPYSQNQNTDTQYTTRGPYNSNNQDPYDQKRSYRDEDYQYQYQQRDCMAGQPPAYYPDQGQQQQQQGYGNQNGNGFQEENIRGGGNVGGGPDVAGLAGMAMEFAGGKGGDKAGKMVKGFLGK